MQENKLNLEEKDERIIARITDDTKEYFERLIDNDYEDNDFIKLQGLNGEFLLKGFYAISKAEGLKNAYYVSYSAKLEGIKMSQLTGSKKSDRDKFDDEEIDTYNAYLDGARVIVKRINGKKCIFADYDLLVYNPKLVIFK